MSKAILISIKPEWVAKIINGEKTIEIRKTMPKCDLPIDVYIYCTKKEELFYSIASGKRHYITFKNRKIKRLINGKVVAKFTLNRVDRFEYETCSTDISGYWLNNGQMFNFKKTCLSYEELFHYIKSGVGYAWHISNLKIFDKPKELSEFYPYCKDEKCEYRNNHCSICYRTPLTKAPQSWCYVEVDYE